MQRRMLAAALVAVLALPATALAQAPPPFPLDVAPHPGPAITAFGGWLAPFTRNEEWRFTWADGVFLVNSRLEHASGFTVGAAADIPITSSVGVSLVGAYTSRGDTKVSVDETEDQFSIDGHDGYLGQVLLGWYLPAQREQFVTRRIILSLHAGGMVLHERPRRKLAPADALRDATHFGGTLGAGLHVPLGGRVTVRLAAEDNIIRWTEAPLRDLAWVYFSRPGETEGRTAATARVTHAWHIRAGLGLRIF
jgi:hypothetical protein